MTYMLVSISYHAYTTFLYFGKMSLNCVKIDAVTEYMYINKDYIKVKRRSLGR